MPDPDPGPGGAAVRLVTATCARCAEERAFEVVARGDRLRMACTVCGLELPARLGPAAHWRDLVEGPPAAPVEG